MSEEIDPLQFQDTFFRNLGSSINLTWLFDFLPDIYLYVKNRQSQFVKLNNAFLDLMGLQEKDLLGKTDLDISPPALAEQYIEEDLRVMEKGAPIPNQVWMVQGMKTMPDWYVSSKVPLFDREGGIYGIAGAMYPLKYSQPTHERFKELAKAIEYIMEHYEEQISIKDLAASVHLSHSQFNRKFNALFHIPPTEYILKIRINAARRYLIETSASVCEIAAETGFYDQSHFSRQFKRVIGMSPNAYRKQGQRFHQSPGFFSAC